MKKLLAFLLTLAMVTGMLSGCAGVPVAVEEPQGNVKEEMAATGEAVKTGLYVSASLSAENATEEAAGTATTDISIIAVTVNDSGVIESCTIDAIQGKVSFDKEGMFPMKEKPKTEEFDQWETWDQPTYRTGGTQPPKSHGGIIAVLLVLLILFAL